MSTQVSPIDAVVQSNSTQTRSAYLKKLLSLASASASTGNFQTLRDHAKLRVQEQTFPSTRDEDWHFTDLSDLLNLDLATSTAAALTVEAIKPFVLSEVPHRLTFVNGFYAPELSQTEGLSTGITVKNLAQADESSLETYLGKQSGAEEIFTALNTTGLTDAAVVQVDKNQVIETPIHLLFITTADQPTLVQPRALITAAANSALTFIEDHVTLNDTAYFTNSVTEVWLADNAQVSHTRIQRDAQTAFHIGKTAVSQARSSRYTCSCITVGAQISRHNLEIYQTGEQTETTLNGLSVARHQQLSDTHSTIALTKPYGTTRQLHKCIVDDRAHAVFNGKVFVPKAAQLTDAGQLNRNLLLSPKARVDTKPQLEIVADNVKCTHGATVGQLETDEIFYLQSRGIDANSARQLLVYAFAYEVLAQIPIDSLKQTLTQQIAPH
jgi:Fe-S cluster assembly protein SufD